MRIWFVSCLFLASWSLAVPAYAGSASSIGSSSDTAIPPYVAVYSDVSSAGRGVASIKGEPEWVAAMGAVAPLTTRDDEAQSPSGASYLPVLYSLLIPGTGEIALGYPKRGVALIALEITAWVGYAYFNDQGLEGREEFEAFADAHWAHSKWINDHAALEGISPKTFAVLDSVGQYHWTGWPGYHSYAAKDDVKLNYYENIGKYDWFISGWADWDPVGKPRNTALRDEYRALRRESNSDLDTADKFIYLSVVTRVFSLVETTILARKKARNPETAEQRSYGFKTRSTGISSGEVAFVYRF